MTLDKSKIVLTFDHPRVSRETQEAAGRRHFWGLDPQVWHVGKLPPLALDVAKAARDGDVIWLWALPMIGAKTRLAGVGGAAQITLFCAACAANKSTIVEGSTGRSSAVRRQKQAMVEEAHKIVTRGGKRLPKTGAGPGRKRVGFESVEIERAAALLWRSKNIASDHAAIREIRETWPGVTERAIRNLGPSGRNKR
jgi:hypothetical protein